MAYTKPEQTEEELGKEIMEQFKLSKLFLDPIHQRMNEQEELYRSYIDKNRYPHNARVFDPRIFRVIETITPRMVANEPTGSFYPQEHGDLVTTEIFNALIKYDWRRADMFPKLVKFVKAMLIFGTAFGRTYWDFREETRKQMVPKEVNGRMVWSMSETEEIDVTVFDGPNFEVLNIYDCFTDPNATDRHDMRWFIYRRFVTLDELERENETRGVAYYKNLDKLRDMYEGKQKQTKGDMVGTTEDLQFREHRRAMLNNQEFLGKDESNPDIVVLRRFTKDGWCDVCPEYGNLVILEVENPYFHSDMPIIYGVDYPYPGELYGMGEIEPLDRIQRAINAVLNQRLDNVQLNLNTMWKVKKTGGVDMHTLVSAPGNIVTMDDMDAVEPIVTPDVTGSTFVQTMNYLTSALQNGSGITDYTIGIDNESNVANKTATGTRLIQQEANAQFKLKIQLFNHMVIQPIANHWKDLRIQFTTEEQQLRILGRDQVAYLREHTELSKVDVEGNPIVPGDLGTKAKLEIGNGEEFAFLNLFPDDIQPSIVGNYDFIASVSSEQLTDPVALQQNFFLALDRVSRPEWVQGLGMQQKTLNYTGLTEKVFAKLNLGIEANDVLMDIPQPEEQMGQGIMPITSEDMQASIGEPRVNPLQSPLEGVQDG